MDRSLKFSECQREIIECPGASPLPHPCAVLHLPKVSSDSALRLREVKNPSFQGAHV